MDLVERFRTFWVRRLNGTEESERVSIVSLFLLRQRDQKMINDRVQQRKPEWLLRNPMLSSTCNMQTEALHNEEYRALGQMPQSPGSPHAGVNAGGMHMGSDILGNLDNYDLAWNSPDMQSPFPDNLLSENNVFDFADTNNCTEIENKCSPVSNALALSPYSELESFDYLQTSPNPPTPTLPAQEPSKLLQQKNMSHILIPHLDRQSSLNMAIEVLGPNDDDDEDFNSESPIPTPFMEDAQVSHFSPSVASSDHPTSSSSNRHRNVSWGGDFAPAVATSNRIRAASEDASAYTNYPVDLESLLQDYIPGITYCTDSQQGTNVNANNSNNTVSSVEDTTCTQTVVSTQPAEQQTLAAVCVPTATLDNVPQLNRESSFNLTLALDQLQPVTEEVEILVDDTAVTTIEISDIEPAAPVTAVVDLTEDAPSTSNADAAPTTTLKRTSSYIRKRSRNNEACRESRKKRKVQREENEVKVQELILDNESLRKKIAELEVEVKETRATLLTRMTGKKVTH